MQIKQLTIIPALLYFLSNPTIAQEEAERPERKTEGFFYGVVFSANDKLYTGMGSDIKIFPVIGYRKDRLEINGPFIRYRVIDKDVFQLYARLEPRFSGYSASDSEIFTGMDKRKISVDGGVEAQYKRGSWRSSVGAKFDLLARSKGYELNAKVGHRFGYGPFSVTPEIGLNYLDQNYVNYYYGVKPSEVTSFRSEYIGKSALNVKLGAALTAPFLGGLARVQIHHIWYGNGIKNSPLVDHNKGFKVMAFLTRYF